MNGKTRTVLQSWDTLTHDAFYLNRVRVLKSFLNLPKFGNAFYFADMDTSINSRIWHRTKAMVLVISQQIKALRNGQPRRINISHPMMIQSLLKWLTIHIDETNTAPVEDTWISSYKSQNVKDMINSTWIHQPSVAPITLAGSSILETFHIHILHDEKWSMTQAWWGDH